MTFENYYVDQAGNGAYTAPLWQEGGAIRGFAGREMQYGNGLGTFGRTLLRWAKPILKYLGREGLKTGVNIGQDLLENRDIKESVSERMKESGAQIATDAVAAVKKKLTGRGRKSRKGRKKKKMARKRRTKTRGNKKPVARRRKTVRRRRSRRKRVKRALSDIFG